MEWYKELPIVTRSYLTACLVTTFAIEFGFVRILSLYLNFDLIIRHGEFWRLLTNFFYFGQFGIGYFFHMTFLVHYSRSLEELTFRGKASDLIFCYLFGAVSLLILNVILWYTNWFSNVLILGPSLVFMIVYVWARRNPDVKMSFLGLFTFNAPYFPWVIIGLETMIGQNWSILDLLGLIVGHLYYYLSYAYPKLSNRNLLKTPEILRHVFDQE